MNIIIGLTGQSGSGKTTVANILAKKGFHHINCDKLVHEKIYTDHSILNEISTNFGAKYIQNGTLNRKSFGTLIFNDKTAYNKLMEILYPHIVHKIKKEIETAKSEFILLDAPTLFEFGLEKMCNKVIGVVSDNVIDRICIRDGISKQQAVQRLSNQKDTSFFKEKCDYIIENNYEFNDLINITASIANSIMEK